MQCRVLSSNNALPLFAKSKAPKSSTSAPNAWISKWSTVNVLAMASCVICVVLSGRDLQAQDAACFSGANIINTCVGGGTAGGSALTVDLPGPTSAVRDGAGNTYIASPYSTYVFKLNGGSVTTFAGTGIEGFSGDGGLAGTAALGLPNGLTIDSKGNIYIADPGDARVRMVNTSGNITTVAGSGIRCEPSTGTCGDGGAATKAYLNFPMSVAVDSAGNIYIADAFDNRIRKVDTTGMITTYAGNGNPCPSPTSSCGDGGSLTAAYLNFPQHLMFDAAGNLYIADTRDNKIRKIAAGGSTITTVAGTGAACAPATSACGDGSLATSAFLHWPMWVYVDSSSNLYIADALDNKVRMVSGLNQTISTLAGTGRAGFSGDGAAATSAKLNSPASVFLDGSGLLVIADTGNQRVRQVSAGTISTIAGGGMGNDGGPASNAILANPYNVAVDGSGNIYIADTANNRIRFVNAQTNLVSTIVGTGIAGYSGDGGAAVDATLSGPTAVAVDASGNLWIADAGNLVIREVNASSQKISTVAGNGSGCPNPSAPSNACGDNGLAVDATFSDPLSIALDSSDNLIIADYTAHRVREVNASSQIITTIAGVGLTGHAGNGGLATLAHLDHPNGVAVDSAGNVYIADSYNNQVRRVTVSNGLINAWAFNNQVTLGGDGGPALNASMWGPIALSIDPTGNLFVGGGNDNVVQRVDAASYTVGTVAGDYAQKGIGGFTGDGGLATAAKLSNFGLAIDTKNNLYIADAGNNRIRTVNLAPIAVLPTAPLNFGTWALNSTSTPKVLKLSNSGGADLSGLGISFTGADPGDFGQTNNCGTSVAVDVVCTLNLTFTPVGYGKRSAILNLNDNASNSPQTVSLTGSGPDFSLSASPNKLTLSPGSTGSSTLTLSPLGQFNQTVSLICIGRPANSTCTLTPSTVTLDGTDNGASTFTLTTTGSVAPGTYNVTVRGTYGTLAHPATIQVTIP